jgi:trimeric autotransporter adhesin
MEVVALRSERVGRRSRRSPSGSRPKLAWLLTGFLALLVAASPADAQRPPKVTITVSVTPERATLEPGDTLQFEAIADFDPGSPQDVTDQVEWRTTESEIARFSKVRGEEGLLTARGPGTVTVRATFEGEERDATGTATVVVGTGEIVSLTTRPSTKRLEVGRPVQFEAKILYANGYQRDVTEDVVWSSTKRRIATVVNDGPEKGKVVPRKIGTTTITAHDPVSGLTNSDGSTQVLSPVTSIHFDETAFILGRGMSTSLRVYGERQDGTRTTLTDDVEYTLDPPNVIELVTRGDDAGKLTAKRKGTVRISARDPDRGLRTLARKAATVVVAGKLKQLKIDPEPFRVGAGESRRPRVVGVLTGGLITNDLRRSVEWSIVDSTVAHVETEGGENGRVDGIKVGTTTLRARDPLSGIATTSTDNLVVRGKVTSVSVDPTNVVLGKGLPYVLRAYANRDDRTRSNIASTAEWTVTPAGVVSVDEGALTAVGDGLATVTAKDPRTGLSGSATVRVAGAPVALDVAPNPFNLDVGETRRARAIARLSSGLDSSDLRALVDWSVGDATIARVGSGEAPAPGESALERGETLGVRNGRTTLQAFEPLTGLRSTQVDNVRVGPQGGGPRPTPRPGPSPGGQRTLVSLRMEVRGNGDVQVGANISYKAFGTYSDGEVENLTNSCEWSVDDPSIASVSNVRPKGEIVGLTEDASTTVRAVCEGLSVSATIEVVGDFVAVRVEPAEFTGAVGDTTQLRAIASFASGNERDITGDSGDVVRWFSTDEKIATVDNEVAKGEVILVAPGEALVAVTTQTGHAAFCTVTVTGGSVASLRVTGDTSALGSVAGEMHAVARFADGTERNVDGLVDWSSSDEDVVRLPERPGFPGEVVGGTKAGRAIVTATWPNGPSASLETRVNAVLESLSIRDASDELGVGERRRVFVRGRFSDGRERDVSRSVELRSSDPDVVRVLEAAGRPARIEAIAPGSATVTAVDPTTGITTPLGLEISVVD